LRQIAVGELSAKAFIKFPPGKLASKRIYTLPVDQQEAIADKGTVTIKTTAGVIEKDPNVLTMKEVNQVLAVGKILEPEEQDARKEKLDTDRMDRPKTTAPRYYWYDGTKSLRVARTGDVPINDIRAEVAIGGYCVPWFNKEQTRIIRKMAQDKNITFDNMIEMLVIKAIGGSK
jgi:hypothetical protein